MTIRGPRRSPYGDMTVGSIVDVPSVGPTRVTGMGKRYFTGENEETGEAVGETGYGLVRNERMGRRD
jgi:hypothetical protein